MSGLREERCLGEIMVTEINRIWAVGAGVAGEGITAQPDDARCQSRRQGRLLQGEPDQATEGAVFSIDSR
ncbi:hypothetical protein B8W70_07610 [Pseudomonas sp. 1239]|nr:hypothetical protein B8W70_07610 [Pseudomonas sp. 1239]